VADPYRKVLPGEPVQFSASVWNAMIDAARGARTIGAVGPAAGPSSTWRPWIRVRNATDDPVDRFGVLGLGGLLYPPASGDLPDALALDPCHEGLLPAAEHAGRFVVLLEPAAPGQVVRGAHSGVCPVQVDRVLASDGWADIAIGETTQLVSAARGSARILWTDDDAVGLTWAVVALGRSNGDSGRWGFLAAGQTISGASGMTLGHGTVTLCSRAGYTLDDDGDSVEVLNAGGEVTAGTGGRILKLGWTEGAWSLDVFPCS